MGLFDSKSTTSVNNYQYDQSQNIGSGSQAQSTTVSGDRNSVIKDSVVASGARSVAGNSGIVASDKAQVTINQSLDADIANKGLSIADSGISLSRDLGLAALSNAETTTKTISDAANRYVESNAALARSGMELAHGISTSNTNTNPLAGNNALILAALGVAAALLFQYMRK